MRVLLVCDHYPPDAGGLATHVRRLAYELLARDHEIMVVAAGAQDGSEDGDAFPVQRIRPSLARLPGAYEAGSPTFHPPWPDPHFRRELSIAAERFDADVVHAHGWCLFSAIAMRAPSSRRVVATLHDHGLACPKKSLMRFDSECAPARGVACWRCDGQPLGKRVGLAGALAASTPLLERRVRRLLAVSGYVARRAEQSGIPGRLLEVVPNFVELPDPAAAPVGSDEISRPYVLYAGPAAPHKGRQVLLEAFRGLGGDTQLCLVGGDGTASADDVLDLGYRTGADLQALYRNALLVVVPSIWPDPCPTVALEAMAWGCPVIASAVGGLTEIVDDGVTGRLVAPDDPAALREAIATTLGDRGRREAMGVEARRRAVRYSSDFVLPQLEEIYDDAAQRTRPRLRPAGAAAHV